MADENETLDIKALLAEDPLDFGDEPQGEVPAEPVPAEPAQNVPQEQQGQEPAPAETAPQNASAPEAPPQTDPSQNAMQEELAQMRRTIAELRQAAQPQETQQPQEGQGQDEFADIQQQYSGQLPQAVLEQLESEDPQVRRQTFNNIIGSMAFTIHRNIRQEMKEQLEQMRTSIPQTVSQLNETRIAQSQARDDFYQTFPQLNRAELYPLVQSVGQQVMKETGMTQWSPQLRDAIGQRVLQTFGAFQPQQPAVPTEPAPAPASLDTGGNSAPRPAPTNTSDPISLLDGLL